MIVNDPTWLSVFPLTRDWVHMNISAPTMSKPVSGPASVRARVPLADLAKSGDVTSAPALGRILPTAGKERVEVAAFQSSI